MPEAADWPVEAVGNGCLEWRGETRRGVGFVEVDGSWVPAHRVAYAEAHGLLDAPARLTVVRTCDNGLCVAQGHLETDELQDWEDLPWAFSR